MHLDRFAKSMCLPQDPNLTLHQVDQSICA